MIRSTRPVRLAALALTLAALGTTLAACGGGGGDDSPTTPTPPTTTPPTTNPPSTSNAVSVRDNSFSPAATTVTRGTTVTWSWSASTAHNVTFTDGVASASQSAGEFTRTFGAAGSFPYRCTLHAGMNGTVTVQ